MISKKLSCGVILVNKKREILMIHTTSQSHWDIPKGTKDLDETELEAALRELTEETSIVIPAESLTDLSWHIYNDFKDLWLYIAVMPDVDMDALICTSTFTKDGIEFPEADRFEMVTLDEAPRLACNSMSRLMHDTLLKDIELFADRQFGYTASA